MKKCHVACLLRRILFGWSFKLLLHEGKGKFFEPMSISIYIYIYLMFQFYLEVVINKSLENAVLYRQENAFVLPLGKEPE